MELDPDEVQQVRDYFRDQQLRWECMTLALELGHIDKQTLRLFVTGEEGWQIAMLPGSPELN